MIRFNNNKDHFGLIAILFHWVMAIVIIGLLLIGIYMTRIPISLIKLKLFGWHKEWGICALLLVLLRIGWRMKSVVPSLVSLPKIEEVAARSVHYAFYFFMLALPISGWLVTSAAGLPVSVFGIITLPNLVSTNENSRILFTQIHQWIGYALIITLCMHMGAALKHHFINKDEIMRRILWP